MAQKYINDGYLVVPEIFDQDTVENIQAEIRKKILLNIEIF